MASSRSTAEAKEQAETLLEMAIDNFKERKGTVEASPIFSVNATGVRTRKTIFGVSK